MCQALEWNHLPVAGGLYDQHPKLIDEWEILFAAVAKHEKQEQARKDAEAAATKSKLRSKR